MKVGDWIVKRLEGHRVFSSGWTYPGRIVYIDDEHVDFRIYGNDELSYAKRTKIRPANKIDFDRQINDVLAEILRLQEEISNLERFQKDVPNE